MLCPHAYGPSATARVCGSGPSSLGCPAPRRPATYGNGWTRRASRTTPISPCRVRPRSKCGRATSPTLAPRPRSASEPAPPPVAEHYRTLAIVQPQNGQSIINTTGQVSVAIAIEPAVQPLHRLSLYLDGKAVTGFPLNTLSYALTEVPRGTHNVNAVVHGSVRQDDSGIATRRVHCATGIDRAAAGRSLAAAAAEAAAARREQNAARRSRATAH